MTCITSTGLTRRLYTEEEGALDLARAVRFVRKNADVYGMDENDIAVMGFSAGGILAGEMLLNFDGLVNGTALDAVEAAGVRVERLELEGRPHGFGYREGWLDTYDSFLTDVFGEN